MWRIALILNIFLLSTLTFGQTDKIKAELAKADGFIASRNFDEALTHAEAALRIDPLYLDALEKKVNIMLLDGNSKEALKEFDKLISENIQQPEYYYIRAIINNYRSRPSKAVEDFDNALYYQLPEKYHDRVYLYRGVAYYNIGKFSEAEIDYSEALDLNPRYAAVYHSWGMLDYELGRFEEAVEKFTKAVEFGDESPVLFYNLGMSYKRMGDKANACHNFNISCNKGGYKDACKLYFLQCEQ